MLNKTRHDKKILKRLSHYIGHDNWFISGSFANHKIKHPNDIDIFFYTEEDYKKTLVRITNDKVGLGGYVTYSTDNALTIYDGDNTIQFVHKNFGTPQEIFNTFDLNVCKVAVLPNGNVIKDPTANEDLQITQVNSQTFRRYFKYVNRLYGASKINEYGKWLIDNYIEDGSICSEYYLDELVNVPTNVILLNSVKEYDILNEYAFKQAVLKAPEILM